MRAWRGRSRLRLWCNSVSISCCDGENCADVRVAGNYFSFPSFEGFQDYQESEDSRQTA